MKTIGKSEILVADRIWVATALLHRQFPSRNDFKKVEIIAKLEEEGLAEGVDRGTVNVHLDQHCVANVAPSSAKYRMLYETTPGGSLRLFRPGDFTYATRYQKRKPSKTIPKIDELPPKYRQLLDWYEKWVGAVPQHTIKPSYENDPLIRLIGTGRHIWADEHADEYVENLRREDL